MLLAAEYPQGPTFGTSSLRACASHRGSVVQDPGSFRGQLGIPQGSFQTGQPVLASTRDPAQRNRAPTVRADLLSSLQSLRRIPSFQKGRDARNDCSEIERLDPTQKSLDAWLLRTAYGRRSRLSLLLFGGRHSDQRNRRHCKYSSSMADLTPASRTVSAPFNHFVSRFRVQRRHRPLSHAGRSPAYRNL